jgi:hypothetical protein
MRASRLITTTVAVVLTLGPTAATAAAGSTASSPSVRPNPDEQITTALAQPTQSGRPAAPAVQPNPDQQTQVASNNRDEPITSMPPVIVRVSNTKSGFDWGDVGIGAAGALGLLLIALAGGFAVAHHRARRTNWPAISR